MHMLSKNQLSKNPLKKKTSNLISALLSNQIEFIPCLFNFDILNVFPDAVSKSNEVFILIIEPKFIHAYLSEILKSNDISLSKFSISQLSSIIHKNETPQFDESFLPLFKDGLALFLNSDSSIIAKEVGISCILLLFRSSDFIPLCQDTLEEYQENIFIEFQRQMSYNNSFLSVCCFHLIFRATFYLSLWKDSLLPLISDNNFFSLLSASLQNSLDHFSVLISYESLSILLNDYQEILTDDPNFDKIITGILNVNLSKHDKELKLAQSYQSRKIRFESQITKINSKQEDLLQKLEQIKNETQAKKEDLEKEKEEVLALKKENTSLRTSRIAIQKLVKKLLDQKAQLLLEIDENRKQIDVLESNATTTKFSN